jgi:hypothetical protein
MAYVSQEKKAQLAPAIRVVLNKYNIKATIAVRNHSTLVVTVTSGNIDFDMAEEQYNQVNTYWIDTHYKGTARKFLNELKAAMEGPGFINEDDAMTDYFHRSHYVDINIGKWNKPYVFMGAREYA